MKSQEANHLEEIQQVYLYKLTGELFQYLIFTIQNLRQKSMSQREKTKERQTLREYLNKYTLLKKSKSAENILLEPSNNARQESVPTSSWEELIHLLHQFVKQRKALEMLLEKVTGLKQLYEVSVQKASSQQILSPFITSTNKTDMPTTIAEPEPSQTCLKSIELMTSMRAQIIEDRMRAISSLGPKNKVETTAKAKQKGQSIFRKQSSCKFFSPNMIPILEKSLEFENEEHCQHHNTQKVEKPLLSSIPKLRVLSPSFS